MTSLKQLLGLGSSEVTETMPVAEFLSEWAND